MTNEQQIINLLAFSVGIEEANSLWNDFKNDVRKKKKAPNTERAFKTLYNKLIELQMQGQDPAKVVEQSYNNAWLSFFPLRQDFTQGQKVTGVDQAFSIAIEPDPLESFIGEQQKLIN